MSTHGRDLEETTMMLFGRSVRVVLDPDMPAREIRFIPSRIPFRFEILSPDDSPPRSAVSKSIERHQRRLTRRSE